MQPSTSNNSKREEVWFFEITLFKLGFDKEKNHKMGPIQREKKVTNHS
jgi:hypothetical protein